MKYLIVFSFFFSYLCTIQAENSEGLGKVIRVDHTLLPVKFKKALDYIDFDQLGGDEGKVQVKVIDNNTLYLNISFSLDEITHQDNWEINIHPSFSPTFHWSPHLSPTENHVIDQHVFRSPTLIVADKKRSLVMIPDLDIMLEGTPVRWYLDLDAPDNILTLGMSKSYVSDHVLFEKEPGAIYPKGNVEIGFYLMLHENRASIDNPFREPLNFFWKKWGSSLYASGNPVGGDLKPYVEHTYNWAFNSWAKDVWQ